MIQWVLVIGKKKRFQKLKRTFHLLKSNLLVLMWKGRKEFGAISLMMKILIPGKIKLSWSSMVVFGFGRLNTSCKQIVASILNQMGMHKLNRTFIRPPSEEEKKGSTLDP